MSDARCWSMPDVLDILNEQTPGVFNQAFRNAVSVAFIAPGDDAQKAARTWMVTCETEWQSKVLERIEALTGTRFIAVISM